MRTSSYGENGVIFISSDLCSEQDPKTRSLELQAEGSTSAEISSRIFHFKTAVRRTTCSPSRTASVRELRASANLRDVHESAVRLESPAENDNLTTVVMQKHPGHDTYYECDIGIEYGINTSATPTASAYTASSVTYAASA